MKVKKKYIVGALITILILLIIIVSILMYTLNFYKISFNEGTRFISNGFSVQPTNIRDINAHLLPSYKNIDILHYKLQFELLPSENKIQGTTNIRGISRKKDLTNIVLNFKDNFEISNVMLNNMNSNYEYKDDRITIKSNLEIADTFNIEIAYSGTPKNLGFGSFTFGEVNNEPVIYSLSEPIFASTWFPCNDTPSDKVLTDVFITNDSNMTSVSNGVLIGTSSNGSRKTYHWKTIYPIATYLISIYSANYEKFSDRYISSFYDTMSIDYYVFGSDLKNAKKDFSIHPAAIKIFSGLFGEYPFIKEKYGVAEFLWNFGAMEHQTITGIGKRFVSGKGLFTDVLVHELAHQWWGNAVTLESWKDIWLNEGFATYSEALYWEMKSGFSSLKSTMRSLNTKFDETTLYNPQQLFSRTIYNKGAWVLHMLRKEVGDSLFFEILQQYYDNFKYKNATTNDFVKLAESISRTNLTQFFDQWVFKGEGKILLNYSYSQNDENEIELKLAQIQDDFSKYLFKLDLDFYLDDGTKLRRTVNVSKRKSTYKFSNEKRVTKIDLDPDNWIAADIKYIDSNEKSD